MPKTVYTVQEVQLYPSALFGEEEWEKAKNEALFGEVMEVLTSSEKQPIVYHIEHHLFHNVQLVQY